MARVCSASVCSASFCSMRLETQVGIYHCGDLEILCALQAAGVPVDGVVFVDPAYADDEGGRFHQALAQAASLLAPVPVTAYPSTTEFAAACLQGKERSVIIYVQADAADVSKKQARALASIALLAGGEAFRLTNQGALQPATMDVWQRNSFPLPARSTGASPPGSALGLARAKPTDEPNRDVRNVVREGWWSASIESIQAKVERGTSRCSSISSPPVARRHRSLVCACLCLHRFFSKTCD